MIENILVGIILLAAIGLIGRKIWRMRCIRAQKTEDGGNDCSGCPGCGPG